MSNSSQPGTQQTDRRTERTHGVNAAEIRWPRKWRGWRTLFWLWLGRCPIHHTPLNIDNALYDDGVRAYCFRCDGVAIWPQGAREALRQNYKAEATKAIARHSEKSL